MSRYLRDYHIMYITYITCVAYDKYIKYIAYIMYMHYKCMPEYLVKHVSEEYWPQELKCPHISVGNKFLLNDISS